MTKAAAIIAILVSLSLPLTANAQAPDFYLGAAGGYGGQTRSPITDHAIVATWSPDDWFFGGYGGVGWRWAAVEAGYWRLPHEHAYGVAPDPLRHGTSTERGSVLFARALIRAPLDWRIRPYAFAGAARVKLTSFEESDCSIALCGKGFVSPFVETITTLRPYVGAGAELGIAGPLSLRAEFGYIPRAVSETHMGTRDEYLGSLALQLRF